MTLFFNYLIVCDYTQLPSKISVRQTNKFLFYKFKILIGVIFITMYIQSIGSETSNIELCPTTSSAMLFGDFYILDEDFFISTVFLAVRNSYLSHFFSFRNNFIKAVRFLSFQLLKYIIIYTIIINIFIYIIYFISFYYQFDLFCNVIPEGQSNDNLPMDPVRWWPSGVPQG
jgi:hypothetical protein